MRGNGKVIGISVTLILSFVLALTCVLYVHGEVSIPEKTITDEEFDPVTSMIGEPTPQSDMQKKFNAMSEVNESNGKKSITVITEETLHKMWDDMTDEDYEVKSLTTEEVLYIINDSIRIYNEYDEIIIPEYRDEEYLNNLPKNEDTSLQSLVKPDFGRSVFEPIHDIDNYRIGEEYFTSYYTDEEKQALIDLPSQSTAYSIMMGQISKLIHFRILALSSPGCTIYMTGGVKDPDDKLYGDVIYVPELEKITEPLSWIQFLEDEYKGQFDFFTYDGYGAAIYLITSAGQQARVFPTEELISLDPNRRQSQDELLTEIIAQCKQDVNSIEKIYWSPEIAIKLDKTLLMMNSIPSDESIFFSPKVIGSSFNKVVSESLFKVQIVFFLDELNDLYPVEYVRQVNEDTIYVVYKVYNDLNEQFFIYIFLEKDHYYYYDEKLPLWRVTARQLYCYENESVQSISSLYGYGIVSVDPINKNDLPNENSYKDESQKEFLYGEIVKGQ